MEKASLRFCPSSLINADSIGQVRSFIKFLYRAAMGFPPPKKSRDFKLSYRCIISHDHKNFGKFTTSVNFDTDFYRIPYMELVQSYSKAELDEVSSRSRVLRLLFFAMHKSIFRNLCVCYASMVMCGYPLCQKYSANLLSDLR